MVVLMDPSDDADDILRANRSREKQYVFDLSFGPAATQVFYPTSLPQNVLFICYFEQNSWVINLSPFLTLSLLNFFFTNLGCASWHTRIVLTSNISKVLNPIVCFGNGEIFHNSIVHFQYLLKDGKLRHVYPQYFTRKSL